MKAVVCREGKLSVQDLPEPVPDKGHVVIEVERCGICGSDLHARDHCDHWERQMARAGFRNFMRSGQDVVLGHEFCGTVLDFGPGSKRKIKPGTRVVAVPALKRGEAIDMVGFSPRSNGALAERMLVQETVMFPVPSGLPARLAALTEPMAVALHAIRRSEVRKQDVAIVIGCGPVGLAVIAILKAIGVQTVVASNGSAPRRELARKCGADILVDPSRESPFADSQRFGHLEGLNDAFGMAFDALNRIDRLPVPWWHAWRMAEKLGAAAPKRPVIFECVGAPGVIEMIVDGAPMFSRVVVAGVCMASDRLEPAMAINKEIDLRFVFGYTPLEYRDALYLLADGKVDGAALITGETGLDGVNAAFDALGSSKDHAKILIEPASAAREIVSPR
jgi:threonine dehydrogenase-like Zn-dependent dehydrogenase